MIRRRCWSWTRPRSCRRGRSRPVSRGSTRGSPGRWRTARSRCSPRTSPRAGRALIDFALYLGKAWAGDAERCREAGVPAGRAKAVVTKAELGRRLVERTRCAGVPFAWVAAGSLYGQDRSLRSALERRGKGYVMAVPCDETVITPGTGPVRVDALAAGVRAAFVRGRFEG
ncbi:transposase [Streptomyces sp. NPDC001774]